MPMYLFGDRESSSKGIKNCFPSYHGEWLVNDWSLGGAKEINELVQIVVGWTPNNVFSHYDINFFENIEKETIIQIAPFQLWLCCCCCCSPSEPVEVKERSLRVNFQVVTRVLDEAGTRECNIFEYVLRQPTKTEGADVFKLLERYVYRRISMDYLDVAIHVADITNITLTYGDMIIDKNGNVLPRTIRSARYDVENIKEYGK